MNKTDRLMKQDNFDTEIQAIKKAIKETKDLRMFQRYIVVLYHLKGYLNYEISKMVCLCQHTVGTYIRKYKESGIEGLTFGHSPGAPHLLMDEQEAKLIEVVTTKTPDEVGFSPRKNWTIAIIMQWVKNTFNVDVSHSGMADILYRLKLSYTRPTYVLAQADSAK